MAKLDTRDPVQGLVDYTNDVKPYHSKILDVWVEYIHNDAVKSTVKDDMQITINMIIDRIEYACKYGFDTQPWNDYWMGDTIEEIIPGTISYDNQGSTASVAKSSALLTYYSYSLQVWRSVNGLADVPNITNDPESQYYILSFPEVMTACKLYFANISDNIDFWFDENTNTLYQRVEPGPGGNVWADQGSADQRDCPLDYPESPLTCWRESGVAYVSPVAPPDAMEGDLWYHTNLKSLQRYVLGSWNQIHSISITSGNNTAPLKYPHEWLSNWDTNVCIPPFGENVAYTYVEDVLMFEHGFEIFLWDRVSGNVIDSPRADNRLNSPPSKPTADYPITYRTTISTDGSNRCTITRSEVSIVTEPDNPDVINNVREIYLDGFEFQGFGVDHARRGVRLQDFNSFIVDESTGRRISVTRPVMNYDTFKFDVDGGLLRVYRYDHATDNWTVSDTSTEEFPFNDGQVVYFTSTDDLPKYSLPTQNNTRDTSLLPYTPYRIKFVSGETTHFSLQLVKATEVRFADTDTVATRADLNPTNMDRTTLYTITDENVVVFSDGRQAFDVELEVGDAIPDTLDRATGDYPSRLVLNDRLMSPDEHLTFTYEGYGSMYMGYGHPISFVERSSIPDTHSIMGIVSAQLNGTSQPAFLLNGKIEIQKGVSFPILNSLNQVNDGDWISQGHVIISNEWIGTDAQNAPIPAPEPDWWNAASFGQWPTPSIVDDSDPQNVIYQYQYYTLLFPSQVPSQQTPAGDVVWTIPVDQNTASVTVAEELNIQFVGG